MEVSESQGIWYAIVNIFAASKKAGKLWRSAEKKLLADRVRFCCEMTGDHGNATSLTHAACARGYRKFIAVGGDGTVHDVLEGIMRYIEDRSHAGDEVLLSDFYLAVIPVGSGNDWIKTAGVPKDIIKAASLLSSGVMRKQDVVKVSILDPSELPEERVRKTSYMANVGGVGLDARVCKRVNSEKRRGKRGRRLYVSALIYNIIHRVPVSARVICDGVEVFHGSFLSMAFGIGKYSGGGMRQTPGAEVDDGLLDMTIIPDLPLMKIAKEAPKLFNGKFHTVKELVCARSKSILVMSDEPVEVDGEVVGVAPVRFDLLEGQINILCP